MRKFLVTTKNEKTGFGIWFEVRGLKKAEKKAKELKEKLPEHTVLIDEIY